MNKQQLGRIETLLHLAAAWVEHEPQLVAAHLREHMQEQIRQAISDVEKAKAQATRTVADNAPSAAPGTRPNE